MTEIAKHIRIFEPNATDEFVEKRIDAIKAIEADFKKKKVLGDTLNLADAFGHLLTNFTGDPQGIATLITGAIKKQSSSFVAEGSELEIVTCGLLGLIQWIESSGNVDLLGVADTISISLWSCLSFQAPLDTEPKLEVLRKELIELCQKRISQAAVHTRKRSETKAVANATVPADNTFATFVTTLNTTYGKVINDMRKNAILDREEIDCLWWVLSEWSDLANCPLGNLNNVQRAIISSVEFATLLRRVPGTAHRNLLLRYLNDDSAYTAGELLEQLGDVVEPIKEYFKKFPVILKSPKPFPLFNILLSGNPTIDGGDSKRSISEWALRGLIEGSLINLNAIIDDAK